MTRFKTVVLALIGMVFAVGIAGSVPAYADPIDCSALPCDFTLNLWKGTGTPTGPFGSVDLASNGSGGIVITVTPGAGMGFMGGNSGAGFALGWDMDLSSISITGLTSGFQLVSNQSGDLHADGTGDWNFAIECTTACGSGGSSPDTHSFSFTIVGASLSDFLKNGKGNDFVSDVCTLVQNGTCAGPTGDTASNEGGSQPVPEPLSLSLFGVGLISTGVLARRRRAKKA